MEDRHDLGVLHAIPSGASISTEESDCTSNQPSSDQDSDNQRSDTLCQQNDADLSPHHDEGVCGNDHVSASPFSIAEYGHHMSLRADVSLNQHPHIVEHQTFQYAYAPEPEIPGVVDSKQSYPDVEDHSQHPNVAVSAMHVKGFEKRGRADKAKKKVDCKMPPPVDPENFVCAHCGTNQVISPAGKGGSSRRKPRNDGKNASTAPRPARPRSIIIDGQKIYLCNACGIYYKRKGVKRTLDGTRPSLLRSKRRRLESKEDSIFYVAVKEAFDQKVADMFWCDCANMCVSRFLMSDPSDKLSLRMDLAHMLLEMHHRAVELKAKKSDGPSDHNRAEDAEMAILPEDQQVLLPALHQHGVAPQLSQAGATAIKRKNIKEYVDYVHQQIDVCRQHKLCGAFRRKLLCYSNGWLYSGTSQRAAPGSASVESSQRSSVVLLPQQQHHQPQQQDDALLSLPAIAPQPVSGSSFMPVQAPMQPSLEQSQQPLSQQPLQQLQQLQQMQQMQQLQDKKRKNKKTFEYTPEELKNVSCCNKECCKKIWTKQVQQWRTQFVEGSADQRWAVLQQMLIGEGYLSSKCVKVIRLITGASPSLVADVSRDLKIHQCMGPRSRAHPQRAMCSQSCSQGGCLSPRTTASVSSPELAPQNFSMSVAAGSSVSSSVQSHGPGLTATNPMQLSSLPPPMGSLPPPIVHMGANASPQYIHTMPSLVHPQMIYVQHHVHQHCVSPHAHLHAHNFGAPIDGGDFCSLPAEMEQDQEVAVDCMFQGRWSPAH